ncbi:hypothetical protein CPAR01_08110 [Colletotrichum paranaense]|uniref:Uncharacterized protein n=1 Tax=Colletotrichum paranaense TaxID=1914294 RepID=A0ABQ9SJD2_9PEZI|nr:uncharacterized protein CPAR01_08110 [Colletotrichum paranaense]KAK1537997.1 hypothetical protein CPAR01_08110 [Colletotrichum paranaense]
MLRFFRGGRVMAGLVTRSLQRCSVKPALVRINSGTEAVLSFATSTYSLAAMTPAAM